MLYTTPSLFQNMRSEQVRPGRQKLGCTLVAGILLFKKTSLLINPPIDSTAAVLAAAADASNSGI